MKNLTSNEIRSLWLDFFSSKKHYIVPSASLIPVNDNSLLWINSGVATLKPYFEGTEQPPSKRLTNSQKVIRTGDIQNVGITTRHHTFFEMLGNFSIGDYFKEEAIKFAWELLTSKNYFSVPEKLLYVTVFKDDKEAINLWKSVGIEEDRIFKMGRDTNFWDMGKGPCGPATEIFFDKGEKYDSGSAKELIELDIENDRYVEIWNIVFSQFNNDGNGNYTELPQKNIDTGAGLERIVSALQNKPTNFETDLFVKIIEKIDLKTKFNYLYDYIPAKLKKENEHQFNVNSWFKKIADYVRAISFAISDGATPDATGRGYILRMLLRKAVINKSKLEINESFLHELVDPLIETMGDFYPKLKTKRDIIISIIKDEEDQFDKTLSIAINKLNEYVQKNELTEEIAYKLHETFGLPLEILKDILEESNELDKLDWDKMEKIDKEFKQKSKGKESETDAMNIQDTIFIGLGETEFVGYDKNTSKSKVIFIKDDFVVFDKTPFYATSGGQESDFGKANEFNVKYVEKNAEKTFIHEIPNNTFNIGDEVELSIDTNRRKALMIHHSATHLLFGGLDEVTGTVIPQHGSKVEEDFLRFDFVYQKEITNEMLKKVETLANGWVKDATDVTIKEMPLDEAKKLGAGYLEGTKYSDVVRVVIMNKSVIDMCGGTHVSNTKEIGPIVITKLEKKGSGVWRIEAAAGEKNISKAIKIINEKINDDVVKPLINKINAYNSKADELEIEKLNFYNELSNLDIDSIDYKKNVELLSKNINAELKNGNSFITLSIESKVKELFKESNIINIESSTLNIQEISRPSLNIIDGAKGDLALLISNNGDKQTCAFIINSKYIDSPIIDKIKEIALKNELRGNGKRQQYIFGGKTKNLSSMIEEIKGWEF